jgi:hypothetical protein
VLQAARSAPSTFIAELKRSAKINMSLPPISKQLLKFAEIELSEAKDIHMYEDILKFAQMAWNYSIYPRQSEEAKHIDELLLRLTLNTGAFVQRQMLVFLERKQRLFPDDIRLITKVIVKTSKGKITVDVASCNFVKSVYV